MKQTLQTAMKESLKAKDKLALQTIRALLTAIQYAEMQKGSDSIPETECLAILQSEIKKRKESLEFEEKAGRQEQINDLLAEIKVIENFLPKQLSEAELRAALEGFKGSNADANMGTAMKYLKDSYPSQYDGKLASSLAKEIFS